MIPTPLDRPTLDDEHPPYCECANLDDDPEHGGRVICGLCARAYVTDPRFTACGRCA